MGDLHPDDLITSALSRRIGRALLEAADELDAMSDPDGKIS